MSMAGSEKRKVLLVFGTRPEAIKMAPVVMALRNSERCIPIVCVTGQHREMLDQVMKIFDIKADYDLDLMAPGQDLFDITSRVLLGVRDVIRDVRPDFMLVHGDTTTCLAGGMAAFYEKIPLGHVEAGLRTFDMSAPFPEEANRTLVASLTSQHFAPTNSAKDNLLHEQIDGDSIVVTGNTGIDALLIAKQRSEEFAPAYWTETFGEALYSRCIDSERKLVLITAHRRENFGNGFLNLCSAIKTLAKTHTSWDFVFPVHPNPNVQEPVNDSLSGFENIHLIAPLDYMPFIWMLNRCEVCLTDSGGVQEEAPSLGTPVLVMRDVTERPEAVKSGCVKLVGTNENKIINELEKSIETPLSDAPVNPYGDGVAANRIVRSLENSFGAGEPALVFSQ